MPVERGMMHVAACDIAKAINDVDILPVVANINVLPSGLRSIKLYGKDDSLFRYEFKSCSAIVKWLCLSIHTITKEVDDARKTEVSGLDRADG